MGSISGFIRNTQYGLISAFLRGPSIKYVRKKMEILPPPPVAGSTFPDPPKVRTLSPPPPPPRERTDQIFTRERCFKQCAVGYLLAIDLIHSVTTVVHVAAMTASEVIRPIRCKRIFYIFACLVPGLRLIWVTPPLDAYSLSTRITYWVQQLYMF